MSKTIYASAVVRGARMRSRYAQLAFASLVAIAGCSSSDGGERVGSHAAAVVLPGTVSLDGSLFEIDINANLTRQNPAPAMDWATVSETRKEDTPSGGGDESFGQGSKEDTAQPTVVTGGIPPNKSDLKFFGIFQEGNTIDGFLNMFWTRVQDPSGTTNMDFELNKRQCTPSTPIQPPTDPDCTSNGLTPFRSVGDLLITYDLSNGGTNPILSLRTWNGSAWGPAANLTESGTATGSINTTPIAAVDSDGLGALSARTFGEAQIAMSALFNPNTCDSFGSVYLKSRSSDSFSAAMKDFVPPEAVNISNCGAVTIHKEDGNGVALAGAGFTLYKDNTPFNGPPPHGAEDTITTFTCTTVLPSGNCTISNVPFGQYWIVETTVPPGGFQPVADVHVVVSATTPSAPITITNVSNTGTINIHKQDDDDPATALQGAIFTLFTDAFPFDGAPPHGGEDLATTKTCTTDAQGNCTITGVIPGQYWIVETSTPAGHATAPDQNRVIAATQTVSLTFINPRQFHVVVFVCKDAGNTLYPSNVTLGAGPAQTSISAADVPAGYESTLCNISKARFNDQRIFPPVSGPYNVTIPQ